MGLDGEILDGATDPQVILSFLSFLSFLLHIFSLFFFSFSLFLFLRENNFH